MVFHDEIRRHIHGLDGIGAAYRRSPAGGYIHSARSLRRLTFWAILVWDIRRILKIACRLEAIGMGAVMASVFYPEIHHECSRLEILRQYNGSNGRETFRSGVTHLPVFTHRQPSRLRVVRQIAPNPGLSG